MCVCGMCVSIIGEMVLFSEYACISGKKRKGQRVTDLTSWKYSIDLQMDFVEKN